MCRESFSAGLAQGFWDVVGLGKSNFNWNCARMPTIGWAEKFSVSCAQLYNIMLNLWSE